MHTYTGLIKILERPNKRLLCFEFCVTMNWEERWEL